MDKNVFYENFDDIYFHHGSSQNWHMTKHHYHRNYEVLLFMNGGASFLVGDRKYIVREGDLFVINSEDFHRTIGGKNIPYQRYVVMFYPEKFRRMEKNLQYPLLKLFENRPENFSHKISLIGKNLDKVVAIMEKIDMHNSMIQEPRHRAGIYLCIMELLLLLEDLYDFFLAPQEVDNELWIDTSNNSGDYHENFASRNRIEEIKTFIQQNVHEQLSLEEIATEFFMSSYYLSHYFKKETGFTLFEYIKAQKILAAKSLLKQGYSVMEISMMLKYSSDSHFISSFKRETGTTPKRYALEKRINNQEEKNEF